MTEQPLPLGYVEQPHPPRRPTFSDPAVCRVAAEEIVPEVIKWLGSDWREHQREGTIDDLMHVVYLWDGYEAARYLEKYSGWSPDQDLVEILGGAWGLAALRRAIAAWAEANKITPKFAVGQTVRARPRGGVGKIVNIDVAHATYTVATQDFLRAHPNQEGKGGGIVVPFEDCVLEEPK